MKTITKALVRTIAAGAMVLPAVGPALAHDNDDWRGGYNYDRAGWEGRDRDRGYGYGRDNPRQAVTMCVRAAEHAARRSTWGRADVTGINDVDRNGHGYTVKGRISVNADGRDWRGDARGWNGGPRGYDSGWFRCRVEYGRVADIDFGGIRGL